MKVKRVADLTRGLIVDLDGALVGEPRGVEERHSAAASALILTARLIGGACINLARLAAAAERIADTLEDESEARGGAAAPGNWRSVADGGTLEDADQEGREHQQSGPVGPDI